jgi:hypothetical protein
MVKNLKCHLFKFWMFVAKTCSRAYCSVLKWQQKNKTKNIKTIISYDTRNFVLDIYCLAFRLSPQAVKSIFKNIIIKFRKELKEFYSQWLLKIDLTLLAGVMIFWH